MNHEQFHEKRQTAALVLPLEKLENTSLQIAGGKATNLATLIQAGFVVPPGFCVTTVAYTRVASYAGLDPLLANLAALAREEYARQIELAAAIRTMLQRTPLPSEVVTAITRAYQELSAGEPVAVAVRSSATAEDLPDASFAGQQETLLQVIGLEAVLMAVQQCFASLWTDRATQYRSSLGLDQRQVRLAVVVQRMVEARVAGVLFTANPLTGRRQETVIDANPGLGEAVVSGTTNPDHFVIETTTGQIVERRLGQKQMVIQAAAEGGTRRVMVEASPTRACLTDEQMRALATLGARVEALYQTPQDIEWAIDPSGQILLLQARPITTLFPLPAGTRTTPDRPGVYLAFGVQQGTSRPFTPMGHAALRLLVAGFLDLIGHPRTDPLTGPAFVTEAAGRPFFEVTAALRSAVGRRFLIAALQEAETSAVAGLTALTEDARLALHPTPRRVLARALVLLFARTRLPWYLLQALVAPGMAGRRVQRLVEYLRQELHQEIAADATTHLAEAERLLFRCLSLAFRVSPVMLAGMLSFELARRLLANLASESECLTILGGSPLNPTTQMNLALWQLARLIRADALSWDLFQHTSAEQLARAYQQGQLPVPCQQGIARFLREYGHQGIAELDLGAPRWSDHPAPLFVLLANALRAADDRLAPDAQLEHAGQAARAMIATLAHRAGRRHRLRGWITRLCLRRAHALAGFREMTRFVIGLVLAQARAHLRLVGAALVQAGRLVQADDIFFFSLSEVHAALRGADLRENVNERRATFEREMRRKHVPLLLLSDGTEPLTALPMNRPGEQIHPMLRGTPASAGQVTAPARVILDPHQAILEPGEILVAPSTDPAWTPLFLTAAGLVMETGGAMAHGAIVAREYGLPAVVGVAGATTRIVTGSRVMLDGTTGIVLLEENDAGQ